MCGRYGNSILNSCSGVLFTAAVYNLVCLKNSQSDGQLNASNYVTSMINDANVNMDAK